MQTHCAPAILVAPAIFIFVRYLVFDNSSIKPCTRNELHCFWYILENVALLSPFKYIPRALHGKAFGFSAIRNRQSQYPLMLILQISNFGIYIHAQVNECDWLAVCISIGVTERRMVCFFFYFANC